MTKRYHLPNSAHWHISRNWRRPRAPWNSFCQSSFGHRSRIFLHPTCSRPLASWMLPDTQRVPFSSNPKEVFIYCFLNLWAGNSESFAGMSRWRRRCVCRLRVPEEKCQGGRTKWTSWIYYLCITISLRRKDQSLLLSLLWCCYQCALRQYTGHLLEIPSIS